MKKQKAKKAHKHTAKCWEKNSTCDLGKNPAHAVTVAEFKVAVPGTVKVTKKGDHAEIVIVGCDVSLSDQKLGIDLTVKQP